MKKCNVFYCFICDKTIASSELQYSHFESHILHKPYKCLDCEETYCSKNDLEAHLALSNHINYQKKTEIKLRKFINSLGALSNKIKEVNGKDIVSIELITKKDNKSVEKCLEKIVIKQEAENKINSYTNKKFSMISKKNELEKVEKENKSLDYIIKMKNDGYLDMKKLSDKKFVKQNYTEKTV